MVKFTDMHCVVDTHIAPATEEEQRYIVDVLEDVLTRLNTREGYRAALCIENPDRLRRVLMLNASIEKGSKYNRIHCHFNLSIMHESKILLKEQNVTLAEWFNSQFPWPTACFAAADLLESSRAKNYNAKAGRVVEHVAAERSGRGEPRRSEQR